MANRLESALPPPRLDFPPHAGTHAPTAAAAVFERPVLGLGAGAESMTVVPDPVGVGTGAEPAVAGVWASPDKTGVPGGATH